jgi:hypothetical protein
MLCRYRPLPCGPPTANSDISPLWVAECCSQYSALTATVSLHSASNPLYLRFRRLNTANTVTVPCLTVTTLLMSCSRQGRPAVRQPVLAGLLQGVATLRSGGVGRIFEGCFEQAVPTSSLRHHLPRELTALPVCRS